MKIPILAGDRMSASPEIRTPSDGGQSPLPLPMRQRLQQLFEYGKRAMEKGEFPQAHDSLSQCVVGDPASVVYLQMLRANLTRKHGDKKKGGALAALTGFRSSRGVVSKPAGKGNWEEAFKAGMADLKGDPFDIGVLVELAAACDTLHHREAQLYYLKWALDIDSKDIETNRAAAQALEEIGEFDQAISCWQRIKEQKPADPESSNAISRLSVEKTLKVGGYNQQMLKEGGGEVTWRSGGADAPEAPAPQDGKTDEQRLLDKIESEPAESKHYLALADLLTSSNRLADAERALAKAMQVTGGGDLRIRERWEDAQLRRLAHQVEVAAHRANEEKSPEAHDLARRMLAQAQQTELEIFAARAHRDPTSSIAQFEFAMRAKRVGKYKEAIQAFQAAKTDRRRLADIQLHLGECFQHIEQFKLAMTHYEAAVQAADAIQTDLKKLALYRAGVLATGLKDVDRAEKHLSDLAEIDFGYRDVSDRLDKLAKLRQNG